MMCSGTNSTSYSQSAEDVCAATGDYLFSVLVGVPLAACANFARRDESLGLRRRRLMPCLVMDAQLCLSGCGWLAVITILSHSLFVSRQDPVAVQESVASVFSVLV